MNATDAYRRYVMPHSRQSDSTARNNLSRLARWKRLSGDPKVDDISSETFSRYRKTIIDAHLSPDTAETDIGVVLTALRHCKRFGAIPDVPWSGMPLKKRSTPKWVPTLEQIGRCYASADAAVWPTYMDPGQFWRTFYVVQLWSGLRRNDTLFRLNREMCAEDAIRCQAQKTGKVHIFPMHPVVWRHLQLMPDTERVFQVGKSLKQIRRELDRISDAAGVSPRIQPQAMRRAAITAWEECAGAGRIIHGCASDVVSNHYLAVRKPPRMLLDGVDRFVWPEEMLTDADRAKKKLGTLQFLRTWRRLSEKDREAVRSIAERLVS
jgi:hypothetical protein